jgi:hypothetical protein
MVTARSAGRVRREPHGLASSIRERAPDALNGTEPVAAQPPGAEDGLGGEDEEAERQAEGRCDKDQGVRQVTSESHSADRGQVGQSGAP